MNNVAKQYCIDHDQEFIEYLRKRGRDEWSIGYRYMSYNPYIEEFYNKGVKMNETYQNMRKMKRKESLERQKERDLELKKHGWKYIYYKYVRKVI